MNVQRGDVVLVDMTLSGGAGAKRRPAVVIQAVRNNQRLRNTIVAGITSNTSRATFEPAQFLVDPNTPEGRQSGLKVPSAVTCENLVTLPLGQILRVIGRLSPAGDG